MSDPKDHAGNGNGKTASYAQTKCSPNAFDHPMPCQNTSPARAGSHGHLGLQLPELLLFVVLLDSDGRLALDLGLRRCGQPADFVADGHGARVEHLLVELFLLELGEFLVEVVFVDGRGGDARGDGLGDFVADGVLLAEVFPVMSSENIKAQKCV